MNGREFSKNTFFSYLAKAIPTLIGLLYTLLVANVLDPSEYGLFTYITALFGGFFLMAFGGLLTDALFVFTARIKSRSFYHKVLIIQQAIVFIVALPFLFASPLISPLLSIQPSSLAIFGVVLLWLTPLNTVWEFLFKGFHRFDSVLESVIVENLANLVLTAVLVLIWGWGLEGIFIAKFVSVWLGSLVYFLRFKRLNFSSEKPVLREVWSFLGWNAAGDLFRQGIAQAFTLLAGAFLSPVVLGAYYVAQKAVNAAVGFPTAAAAEVLLPHVSENTDLKKLSTDSSKVIRVSIFVSVSIAVGVALLVPQTLHFLFPKYEQAETLVLPFCLLFITNSLTIPANIFRSQNWMKPLAAVQFGALVLSLAAGYIFTVRWGATGLIAAQALVWLCAGLAMMEILRRKGIKLDLFPRISDAESLKKIIGSVMKR